jgi:hypothetical protein
MRKNPVCKRKKSSFIRTMHPPTKVFWQWHYEFLEHQHCSPDLAPSDFYLFPKLKLFLAGQLFSSNQDATAAVEGFFSFFSKNRYRDGIMVLEHC